MERTAILLAVILVLVPAAAAQTPTDVSVALQSWDGELRVGQVQDITLVITYNCAKADQAEGTEIDINVTRPTWANVSGPRSVVVQPDAGTCLENQGELKHPVAYQVSVTRQAPALLEGNVTFNATAQYAEGNASDEIQETLAARFLADIGVDVQPRRIEAFAGRTAQHNLTVTNLGNGPISISVTAIQVDTGLQLRLPSTGQAPSPLGDEEPVWRGTIGITAQLPADVDARTFNATLEVEAGHAEGGGEETATRQINLTAAIERHPSEVDDGSVPGFEVLAVVAAAAVAARLRRR